MFEFPHKMMKVFKDETLQASFEENGFVIVDFYSNSVVKEIVRFYKEVHNTENQKFYPSTYTNDEKYRQLINDKSSSYFRFY